MLDERTLRILPMRTVAAAERARFEPDCPPITRTVLSAILFSTVFLTRFALSASGSRTELALVLVVLLLGVALLVLTGGLRVHVTRAVLFGVTMVAMLLSTGMNIGHQISPTSLLNLLALYFCYIFVAPGEDTYAWAIRLFRRFMLIIAIVGIIQFFAQFAMHGPMLFTFQGIVPDNLVSHGFNYVIPVSGLNNVNKSNGFFLVEPSSMSQMMTLAIIVELLYFRASWRLAVLGLGLLLSFSGTGLIMFALVVPALLVRTGRGAIVAIAVPVMILLAAVGASIHIDQAFNRINEFANPQSSGFARFISPFYLFGDYILPYFTTTLFGMGPGSIEPFFTKTSYTIFDPTWGKLFFEYGLMGTIPFAIFMLYSFFAGARSGWLSLALFIDYLVMGGNLLDARLNALILFLVVFQGRPAAARRPRPHHLYGGLGHYPGDEAAQSPPQRFIRAEG